MKEIVVLSGKGGTGKTSIVASFAALAQSKVLADCDVDAADLHLLLKPKVKEGKEFWSGQVAFIDEDKCTECGLCQELCRFGAIKDFEVDLLSCHRYEGQHEWAFVYLGNKIRLFMPRQVGYCSGKLRKVGSASAAERQAPR
jgi:ferredoxin